MKNVGEMPASEPVAYDDDTARLSVFLRFPGNTCMIARHIIRSGSYQTHVAGPQIASSKV